MGEGSWSEREGKWNGRNQERGEGGGENSRRGSERRKTLNNRVCASGKSEGGGVSEGWSGRMSGVCIGGIKEGDGRNGSKLASLNHR